MKVIIAVIAVLAILFATTNATSLEMKATSPSRDQVIQFLEGFALGIEAEIGNVEMCTKDANLALTDMTQAFHDLEHGFRTLSVSQIEKGLIEFGNGLKEVSTALKDCNVTTLVTEIEHLAEDLASGSSGIIKVVVKEAINIFHHGREITKDFKDAITYYKVGNYQLCGVATGKITGILLEPFEVVQCRLNAKKLMRLRKPVKTQSSVFACLKKCLGDKVTWGKLLEVVAQCKLDKKCYVHELGEDAIDCIEKCT